MKKTNILAKFYLANFQELPKSWCQFVCGLFLGVLTSPSFILPNKYYKHILDSFVYDTLADSPQPNNPPYSKRFLLILIVVCILSPIIVFGPKLITIITVGLIFLFFDSMANYKTLFVKFIKYIIKFIKYLQKNLQKKCPQINWKD